jgi:MFS transporter, YNFM family, putative membrane transport protein
MKYKLIVGTTLIPFIALAVVTLLYIFLPIPENLLIFIKGSTPSNVSLLTSVFGIFYAIGLIIWGILSDKIGKDFTLAIGLLLLALITFIIPLISGYYLLLLARSIQGFCAASFPPVALAWISVNLADATKSKAISIISCAFLLATTIGQWFGSIMIVDSLHKSMWFLGIIYALGAVCFYFNSSKSNRKKPTPQKTTITSIFSKLPNILFNKKLFPIYCCSLFVLLSFVSLYSILHHSSLIIYVPTLRNISIIAILFSLTAGYIFKLIKPLYALFMALCLMSISLLIHCFYINDQLNFVSFLFIIHFIFIFGLAYAIPSMITCITIESEAESRGIAISLYTCVLFIGASVGAFLPTIFETNTLILLVTLFLFICALQLMLNKRNYH